MYTWHKLSAGEREQLVNTRRERGYPWHSPPHLNSNSQFYHLSAACYRHQSFIGFSLQRMQAFSHSLLDFLRQDDMKLFAWCLLPNHYHLLIQCEKLLELSKSIGQLHGRTSFLWNGEENQRGMQVWHRCSDRAIRGENHFCATMNYIHHNPIKHGYVKKWQDWPFSSAQEFIERQGMERVKYLWERYPIYDYGKGWDE